MRPGAKGTSTSCPAFFAACSTAAHPPSTIRSARETCFPPACEPLNSRWIPSRVRSTSASSAGLLTSQSFWGARRMRAPLAPPRLSVPRCVDAEAQAAETSWEIVSPEARIVPLSAAMSCAPISSWVTGGTGSCQICGSAGTSGPRYRADRPHVAVGQLEPRLGEGVGELLRVLVEAPRDRLVDRIHPQREVRREHHRGVALRRILGIRHRARRGRIRRDPLPRTGRALHLLPLVAEQGPEVGVVPRDRGGRPGALQPAGDGVVTRAGAEVVRPAEALLLQGRPLGLAAEV